MRCGAAILVEPKRRKGSGREYEKVKLLTSGYWLRIFGSDRPEGRVPTHLEGKPWVICDGEIEATVAAEDEPHFGGHSASLEVTYKCKKCGNTHFPELPGKYTISKFLTEYAATAPNPWLTYDPKFGDQRLCLCGHEYGRHFDSYDNNDSVGCKYCGCSTFTPTPET